MSKRPYDEDWSSDDPDTNHVYSIKQSFNRMTHDGKKEMSADLLLEAYGVTQKTLHFYQPEDYDKIDFVKALLPHFPMMKPAHIDVAYHFWQTFVEKVTGGVISGYYHDGRVYLFIGDCGLDDDQWSKKYTKGFYELYTGESRETTKFVFFLTFFSQIRHNLNRVHVADTMFKSFELEDLHYCKPLVKYLAEKFMFGKVFADKATD